jgi:plasmid replication initiation protein
MSNITPEQPRERRHSIVIKADGATHSEHPLALQQYKLFDVLVSVAFDELETHDIHAVSLSLVYESLDYTVDSRFELDVCMTALMHREHRWNIFDKDHQIWGATTAIASYEIDEKRGELRFAFSPHLRERLQSKPYTIYQIPEQNRLQSKPSFVLNQFLRSYFRDKHGKGETQWIALVDYKALMGVEEDQYERWGDLCKWLISDPLEEIEENLPFTVQVLTQKRGRRIGAIKFLMKIKPRRAIKSPHSASQTSIQANLQASMNLFTDDDTLCFAELPVGRKYKLVGGADKMFIKIGAETAQEVVSRKQITIKNLAAQVLPQ